MEFLVKPNEEEVKPMGCVLLEDPNCLRLRL